ncbi:hypothetical protein MMC29_000382 [Sticta canariensis]|nr:hypothetical protein [Sticta canariensis]
MSYLKPCCLSPAAASTAEKKGAKRSWRLANMPAFYNAVAVDLAVTHLGVSFVLEFNQPKFAQADHDSLRQFWERTRRLGHGMLICLRIAAAAAGDQPLLIFATIVKRDVKMLAHSSTSQPPSCFGDLKHRSHGIWVSAEPGQQVLDLGFELSLAESEE